MYWKTPDYFGLNEAQINEIAERLYAEAISESTQSCHDCGVSPGEIHHPACDVARCGSCKGQAISCGCGDTSATDVWTGLWPGVQECYERKLITYSDPTVLGGTGWTFDLNTLASQR